MHDYSEPSYVSLMNTLRKSIEKDGLPHCILVGVGLARFVIDKMESAFTLYCGKDEVLTFPDMENLAKVVECLATVPDPYDAFDYFVEEAREQQSGKPN